MFAMFQGPCSGGNTHATRILDVSFLFLYFSATLHIYLVHEQYEAGDIKGRLLATTVRFVLFPRVPPAPAPTRSLLFKRPTPNQNLPE